MVTGRFDKQGRSIDAPAFSFPVSPLQPPPDDLALHSSSVLQIPCFIWLRRESGGEGMAIRLVFTVFGTLALWALLWSLVSASPPSLVFGGDRDDEIVVAAAGDIDHDGNATGEADAVYDYTIYYRHVQQKRSQGKPCPTGKGPCRLRLGEGDWTVWLVSRDGDYRGPNVTKGDGCCVGPDYGFFLEGTATPTPTPRPLPHRRRPQCRMSNRGKKRHGAQAKSPL